MDADSHVLLDLLDRFCAGYQKELAVLLWHRSRDYADRKRHSAAKECC